MLLCHTCETIRYSNWRLGVLSTTNITHNYFLIAYFSKPKAIDWMQNQERKNEEEDEWALVCVVKAKNMNESVPKSEEKKKKTSVNILVYSFSRALVWFCFALFARGINPFQRQPKTWM